MPDLLVQLDGATVPLSSCDYVMWGLCGCPTGVASAGDDIVTEDDAWKLFFHLKRDREKAKRIRRLELMTHSRYCADVMPLMLAPCPHAAAEPAKEDTSDLDA